MTAALQRTRIVISFTTLAFTACGDAAHRVFDESAEYAMTLPSGYSGQEPGVSSPRFIRTGNASLEVRDLDQAIDAARDLAARANGFVAETEMNAQRDDARRAVLVLRVPSDSLDSLLQDVRSLGRITSMSVTATDVSREYFDTETRLAVKEETVRRLRDLIGRSASVEDLVAVERELSRTTTELEALKGQIRYYDRRLAESDLRIGMAESTGGLRTGAFRPLGEAFRSALDVFAKSLAILVYFVVFLIPWLLLAVLLWPVGTRAARAIRKRRAAGAS